MKKEVDSDLTMIQGDPDPLDLSFEEMLKNAPEGSVTDLGPKITSQAGANEYMAAMTDRDLVKRSMEQGQVDIDLDANRSLFEDTNTVRARNQSEFVKGIKAIGGGLINGALIAMEEAGYVADFNTYANMFKELEDNSGNWWTGLMRDAQEGLRESKAFKIYENAPDENSLLLGNIFKWTSLEGAISSAVGFGLTGLGASKLVSYLGSAGKFKELGQFVDVTLGNIKAEKAVAKAAALGVGKVGQAVAKQEAIQSAMGTARAFTGPLGSSIMSNYFMGQLMAVDTYEQAMEEFKPMIDSGEISALEAQALSSKEAQDVVGLNMMLTATAYIRFSNIFKRPNRITGLVQNPTAMNQMKNLIKAGAPTAFVENVYQEMIQMEQLYDIKTATGRESKYSEDPWDRMVQLGLSNRALHAGALGVVGGPIQFAIIQRPMMGKQLKAQRETYTEQQARIGWHEAFIAKDFNNFTEYEKAFNQAVIKGNLKEAEVFNDMGMIEEVSKAVRWGTLAAFKHDVNKIRNFTPEQAAKEDYKEGYKETAERLLNTIERAQFHVSQTAGLNNTAEVVRNVLFQERVEKELGEAYGLTADLKGQVVEAVAKKFPNAEVRFEDGKLSYVRQAARFKGLKDSERVKLQKQEAKENEALENVMKYNKAYRDYKDNQKDIKKYEKFHDQLGARFAEMLTDKYQEEAAKDQKEAVEKTNQEIKDLGNVLKGDKTEDAPKRGTTQTKVIKDNELTAEEIEKQVETWDKTPPLKKHAIKDQTFVSRDVDGTVAPYTVGELKRSNDGRYFRVVHQNTINIFGEKVAKEKRGVYNMPLLKEADETGKFLPDAEVFALENHSFLRPESLQPKFNRGDPEKRTHNFESVWGTYVPTDTALKPFNLENQLNKAKNAREGKVLGLNIPASMLKDGDYSQLEDYDYHLLSLPFAQPRDVVYKVRQEGPTETYVDVYYNDNGVQKKLTRLSRDGNLNHSELVNLIISGKGEVTGKHVNNYSSRANLVQQYDEDGKKIYYDLTEFEGVKEDYTI
ncbi:MAG: hypothetical protein HKN39_05130, partial [Flavobacteriales bacterium]|nr:hypothetical protein [Flavobacteriales bacterium]